MDLSDTIRQLTRSRDRLDEMIVTLQELRHREIAREASARQIVRKRRGRKSMGAQEREVVAARMKAYWARWREKRIAEAAG